MIKEERFILYRALNGIIRSVNLAQEKFYLRVIRMCSFMYVHLFIFFSVWKHDEWKSNVWWSSFTWSNRNFILKGYQVVKLLV